MTARFLEILVEVQKNAAEMVVHKEVLKRGPYWYGIGGVKNRYNDVLISNVTPAQAEEIASLLNALEK